MTDAEHAAVLRRHADMYDAWWVGSGAPERAAIERAIELLEKSSHETAQHLADRYPSSRTGLRP